MSINLPAAVYQSAIDRVQVFVQGSDGHLYDNFWDGTQWVWEDRGTPPGSTVHCARPTVVYQSAIDRVQVFVRGSDGHLYDNFWDGARWVWEDHGTPPGSTSVEYLNPFAAVYQSAIDRVQVFVLGGNDGHLYDNFWDGTQWVWEDHGTPPGTGFGGSPAAVYQSAIDRVQVFVQGSNGHVYDNFWDGARWVWEDHGTHPDTSIGGIPLAVVYQLVIDRVQVFDSGGAHLYGNFWDGARWVWEDHGTPPGTGVGVLDGTHAAVYQSAIDRVQVFVKGSDGHLYDNFWDGARWVWEDHGTPF